MPDHTNWMVLGDFNLIKAQENRNKSGGNIEEMFLFNEAISTLGLNEIPFTEHEIHLVKHAGSPTSRKIGLGIYFQFLDSFLPKHSS